MTLRDVFVICENAEFKPGCKVSYFDNPGKVGTITDSSPKIRIGRKYWCVEFPWTQEEIDLRKSRQFDAGPNSFLHSWVAEDQMHIVGDD